MYLEACIRNVRAARPEISAVSVLSHTGREKKTLIDPPHHISFSICSQLNTTEIGEVMMAMGRL
jgi:hypothetical protein